MRRGLVLIFASLVSARCFAVEPLCEEALRALAPYRTALKPHTASLPQDPRLISPEQHFKTLNLVRSLHEAAGISVATRDDSEGPFLEYAPRENGHPFNHFAYRAAQTRDTMVVYDKLRDGALAQFEDRESNGERNRILVSRSGAFHTIPVGEEEHELLHAVYVDTKAKREDSLFIGVMFSDSHILREVTWPGKPGPG